LTEEDSKKRVGLIKDRIGRIKGKNKGQEERTQSVKRGDGAEMAELRVWLEGMKKELLTAIREGFEQNQEK
jgi:hypothetical protein